jgi:competence protein ComEA
MSLAAAIILGAVTLLFTRSGNQPEKTAQTIIQTPKVAVVPPQPTPTAPPPAPPAPPAAKPEPEPAPQPAPPEGSTPPPISQPEIKEIVVDVRGQVQRPAVYTMKEGARINEAIRMAGGVTEFGDISDINLVAPLMDGTTLVIPTASKQEKAGNALTLHRGESAAALNPPQYTRSGSRNLPPSTTATESPKAEAKSEIKAGQPTKESPKSTLINVNTASQQELETLPGIGPKLAQAIIQERTNSPFKSVDEVGRVPRIGDKTLEKLRPLITVQ